MSSIYKTEDFDYIKKVIDNQYRDALSLLDRLKEGHADKDDLDLLVDIVSDDFSRNGLDDNDEPNDYGRKIESLIDKLIN